MTLFPAPRPTDELSQRVVVGVRLDSLFKIVKKNIEKNTKQLYEKRKGGNNIWQGGKPGHTKEEALGHYKNNQTNICAFGHTHPHMPSHLSTYHICE